MANFHKTDYATSERLAPAGWEEIASGSAGEILKDLAAGKHGRPGVLSLLIEGHEDRISFRALSDLVAKHGQLDGHDGAPT